MGIRKKKKKKKGGEKKKITPFGRNGKENMRIHKYFLNDLEFPVFLDIISPLRIQKIIIIIIMLIVKIIIKKKIIIINKRQYLCLIWGCHACLK